MPSPLSDVLTVVRPDTLGEPYMAQIFWHRLKPRSKPGVTNLNKADSWFRSLLKYVRIRIYSHYLATRKYETRLELE